MVTRSLCLLHFLSGFLLVVFLQEGKDVTSVGAFSLLHMPHNHNQPSSHQRSSSCHSAGATIIPRPSRMNIGASSGVGTKCTASTSRTTKIAPHRLLAKSDGDEEEMGITAPGMNDAFRQLDALDYIGNDDSSDSSTRKNSSTKTSPILPLETTPLAEAAPPEKQVQVYTEMVKELEQQDQEDLYSDVLADMGGDPNAMIAAKKMSKSLPSLNDNSHTVPSSLDMDTETFMNQALQEALKEATAANKDKAGINNKQSSSSTMANSVLKNKEIMKEIEQIFERGNDQLMESIEEMRAEQRELARTSAEDNAQSAMDDIGVNAQRLARAESSMVAMLERVNQETAAVEKAVQDLQQAQMDTSNKNTQSAISKLRQGGIPKQAALAGLLLFSFRSIADSIAAMGGSGSGDMTAALIQGAIALACGVYLILF